MTDPFATQASATDADAPSTAVDNGASTVAEVNDWPAEPSNLGAGVRLACFRAVGADDFVASGGRLLGLIGLGVCIYAAGGYLATPAPALFDSYGVLGVAGLFAFSFIGILLIALCAGSIASMLKLSIMLLAAVPFVHVVAYAIYFFNWKVLQVETAWPYTLINVAMMGWMLAIAWRALRLLYQQSVGRTAALLAIYAIASQAPQALLPQPSLWYTDYDTTHAASAPVSRINVESTFYAQQGLVNDALAAVKAERPGVADTYLVNFGSCASEDVFMNEVHLVRDLFEQRFDAGGRTVSLINNRATVDEVPLANTHNLDKVLGEVGRRMNTDEDVLVLFLTSHGSKDGRLSTRFRPLALNALEPQALRDMLDRSGIKWRVVVVSACYSGTFIDALRDEHTLVMTASRADRTSFGCGPDSKLTYFGRHFFDRALRESTSFLAAFEQAKSSIAEQETAEGLTHSEPQMFLGDRIEAKLAEIERSLQ